MTYTTVVIVAPSSAKAGYVVVVEAKITNIYTSTLVVYARGTVDGTTLDFGVGQILDPGETGSFYASFTMPNRDVIVSVGSWMGAAIGIDATAEKAITLEEVAVPEPEFQGFQFTEYVRR